MNVFYKHECPAHIDFLLRKRRNRAMCDNVILPGYSLTLVMHRSLDNIFYSKATVWKKN